MNTMSAAHLIQEADQLLATAKKELNRAEEDAITHAVCFNSRQSIINYLSSFLLQNQVEIKQPATMASLRDQCRAVDTRFSILNLDNIHCRFESDHQEYCLDVAQVEECFQVADQARGLVMAVLTDHR